MPIVRTSPVRPWSASRAYNRYLTGYDEQIKQLKAQQQKFVDLEQRLGARVEAFRAQKEMVKAQYGAAQAQVHIQEATTGLSEDMADVKMAMDRAQDKVLQTQARAKAMDELIQSGTLDEIGAGPQDDLDQQLEALTSQADQKGVDQQLAALKTSRQLTAGQEASQPPEAASLDTPTPPTQAGGQNE